MNDAHPDRLERAPLPTASRDHRVRVRLVTRNLRMPSSRPTFVVVTLCGVLMAGLLPGTGAAAAGRATAVELTSGAAVRTSTVDVTSVVERRRVDSVPTPTLRWYRCKKFAECATVRVPLDYDQPKGPATQLALVRIKARDQRARIGSLFIGAGGPGNAATESILSAPGFLSDAVLDRFDIVGVDPRGIGSSDRVQCFPDALQRDTALAPLDQLIFPLGRAEETAFVKAAKALGRACSTTGRPLTGSMSSSQVARDLDLMRRAVGDEKLTYLGFSYSSVQGQYYANMFPDRVRALAIDGIIDPVAWVGTPSTRETIQDERLRDADGAYKALREVLVRCDRAGGQKCAFATGDPVKNFDRIARRLRVKPYPVQDANGETVPVTYARFVSSVWQALNEPDGYRDITDLAAQLLVITEPPSARTAGELRAAGRRAAALLAAPRASAPSRGFPYDNALDAYNAVRCTDGMHPADAALWPAKAAAADRRAPYFGRYWAYSSIPCARSTWTVRDEDAYTGPWTKRTSGPVLVIGNYWDPATTYQAAVQVSKLLPNSRLLANDTWGHLSYGKSACTTTATDRFLLTLALPKAGAVCRGDIQPFQPAKAGARATATKAGLTAAADAATKAALKGKAAAAPPKMLPPLAHPWQRR